MNKFEISIIIINYNTSELTHNCVESILEHEYNKSIEFIIIDNASNNNDFENLEKLTLKFENLKLIKSKINLGFAAGNMYGYQFASGDYIAFINSDVLFTSPVLDKLKNFIIENPNAGVCGPQILNSDLQETTSFRHFEGVRYKLFGKKFLEATSPAKPSLLKKYEKPIAVDFIIGSFMFFNLEAFKKIGGFDCNTFLYYEETDICFRLKKIGYSTYFIPSLQYIHLEGKSSNLNLNIKLEHLISYLYITRKNFGFIKYLIIKNFLIISYFFKAPFKKKNRFIFKNLIKMNESLALSMRHNQKID